MSIHRIFVRKREGFAHEATSMYQTIRTELNIPVKAVTIYERYDIEGVSDEDLANAKQLIFSEPPVDELFDTLPETEHTHIIATEYVPGQYDQRADSAEQCLAMLTLKSGATVRTARVFALEGNLSADDLVRRKLHYCRRSYFEIPSSGIGTCHERCRFGSHSGLFRQYGETQPNHHGNPRFRHLLVRPLPSHHIHDGTYGYHY